MSMISWRATWNVQTYPVSLYKPTYTKELVGDYNVKARQLYDRGMISQAKYFSLLYDMGIDLEKEVSDGKGESNIGCCRCYLPFHSYRLWSRGDCK